MKILVTGSSGFIGKNLVRRLERAGHELRALVRPSSNRTGFADSVEIVEGDVTDIEALRRATSGCQLAYHLAAVVKSWVPDRRVFDDVNVGGLRNVLQASRESGLEKIIYTSSFMALGPTDGRIVDEAQKHSGTQFCNDYERSKALADRVALEAAAGGAPLVILYPGVVYGPGELTDGNLIVKMVADHLNGKLPGIIGPGDRRWSYVFVEDVLEGHLLALEKGKPGERYLLAGDNVTNQELFEVVEKLTGRKPPALHIPYAIAWAMGLAAVGLANVIRKPPLITHEVVDVFRHEWAYSSEKAKTHLGYRHRSLEAGLSETLDWMKGQGLVA